MYIDRERGRDNLVPVISINQLVDYSTCITNPAF